MHQANSAVLPAGQRAHPPVVRRPVFPVPVWGDDQEDQDEAVLLQLDARVASELGRGLVGPGLLW